MPAFLASIEALTLAARTARAFAEFALALEAAGPASLSGEPLMKETR
jgi:hypothetical protein